MNEDDIEARLRRELADQVAGVEPSDDGLGRVRERVAAQSPRRGTLFRRPAIAVAGALVVGAATVLGAGALLGDDDGDVTTVAAPTPSTTPTTVATQAPVTVPTPGPPTAAPSAGPEVTVTPGDCAGDAVGSPAALYRLGPDGDGHRLYREFLPLPAGADLCTALDAALTGAPVDPDYSSLWPAGTQVRSLTVEGGTATVDLSEAALDRESGAADVRVSVQQVVYTLTALDPDITRVTVTIGGQPLEELWGQDVDAVEVERAPMADVQGLVWIIDPAQDSESGSPVAVRVFGTANEGNVVLQVFRGDTQVEGTFVTTAMGEFAEGTTEIALPVGTYTLRAYDESGEDGTLIERDSKSFTVR